MMLGCTSTCLNRPFSWNTALYSQSKNWWSERIVSCLLVIMLAYVCASMLGRIDWKDSVCVLSILVPCSYRPAQMQIDLQKMVKRKTWIIASQKCCAEAHQFLPGVVNTGNSEVLHSFQVATSRRNRLGRQKPWAEFLAATPQLRLSESRTINPISGFLSFYFFVHLFLITEQNWQDAGRNEQDTDRGLRCKLRFTVPHIDLASEFTCIFTDQ